MKRTVLTLALVLGIVPSAASAETGVVALSLGGSAIFDVERGVLLLPFRGKRPNRYAFQNGTTAYLEYQAEPGLRKKEIHPIHPLLLRLFVSQAENGMVRITADGRAPIRLLPEIEEARGGWRLLVRFLPGQPDGSKPKAAPSLEPEAEE